MKHLLESRTRIVVAAGNTCIQIALKLILLRRGQRHCRMPSITGHVVHCPLCSDGSRVAGQRRYCGDRIDPLSAWPHRQKGMITCGLRNGRLIGWQGWRDLDRLHPPDRAFRLLWCAARNQYERRCYAEHSVRQESSLIHDHLYQKAAAGATIRMTINMTLTWAMPALIPTATSAMKFCRCRRIARIAASVKRTAVGRNARPMDHAPITLNARIAPAAAHSTFTQSRNAPTAPAPLKINISNR